MSLLNLVALKGAREIEDALAAELPKIIPLMKTLWPICRSITGPGVRESLDIISKDIPMSRFTTPSGSQVFDWVVPPEWSIRKAYIENENGDVIVNFSENNLHVVSYSVAVDEWVDLETLQQHLHSIPEMPEAIPYITSYYRDTWGFCLSQIQRDALEPGKYHVVIDSTHDKNGKLDFGESFIGNPQNPAILMSTYLCHPSMANNELSGPCLQKVLLQILNQMSGLRFGIRAAWTTETIGTICYLHKFAEQLKKEIKFGCVITTVGDDGPFTIVQPRKDNTWSHKIIEHMQQFSQEAHRIDEVPFYPTGSDERQYCSPGINLPVFRFSRSEYEDYPEYHSSLDNFDIVTEESLQDSLKLLLRMIQTVEMSLIPVRRELCGEMQMGKRGLYHGGRTSLSQETSKMQWILAYADGDYDLIDIATQAKIPVWELLKAAETLANADLIDFRCAVS